MTKISQLTDLGDNLAASDEFVIRDVSDASTPNKKVTASGFANAVANLGLLTLIAAGSGPQSRVQCTSSGTSEIVFTTSATERLRINNAGQVASSSLGSAAVPIFTFSGDTNTGIYSPGADQVAISTNGTGRLFINSNGQIGAGVSPAQSGTRSQYSRFTVQGNNQSTSDGAQVNLASNTNAPSLNTGDTLGQIIFTDNGPGEYGRIACQMDGAGAGSGDYPGRLIFSTTADGASSPTERMRLDSSGRLGLGTSSPSNGRLHVVQLNSDATPNAVYAQLSGVTYPGTDATSAGKFVNQALGASAYGIWAETTDVSYGTRYAGYLKCAGYVYAESYGLYAENTQPNVAGAGTAYAGYFKALSAGTGTGGTVYGLRVENTDAVGGTSYGALISTVSGPSTVIPFRVDHAGSTRFTIDSSGRVGIGTTSPDALLTVNGVGAFGVGAFGAGAVTTPSIAATGDLNTGFWFPAADTIAASTGGSERLRVDSSGRLLVGTSTSTLGGNAFRLAIVGTKTYSELIPRDGLAVADNTATAQGVGGSITLHGIYDGSGNYTAFGGIEGQKENGTSGNYAGALVLKSRTNLGNLNEALRIDSSQRLLVGTSSASGTDDYSALISANGGANADRQVVLCLQRTGGSISGDENNRSTWLTFADSINYTLIAGIGGNRPAPAANFDGGLHFAVASNRGISTVQSVDDLTEAMRINDACELLIGYTADNGSYKLQVNSQIFATSSTVATSDGRYKENVDTLDGCLDLVKALRPVIFTWKPQENITRISDDGSEVLVREGHNFPKGTQVGFIAQEVQEALADKPWLGSVIKENIRPAIKDNEGNELAPEEQFFGIAEGNLIAVLTNALQEAIGRIETLEAEVADLKGV
jgi:hypothetical protein